MAKPRYLTKSRFKLAVECPRKLFYTGKKAIYQDAMAEDAFLEMLAEGGYQVGALAKLRYPEGIEIRETDHAAAEAATQALLERDQVVLFEPAIRVGDFFIRIDVLVKDGNNFELIEVKAKSYNSVKPEFFGARGGIRSDMLPYFQDAAFQRWILQQAFPGAAIKTFLMMPDKAQIAPISGINQFFRILPNREVESTIPTGVDGRALAELLLAKVDITASVSEILASPLAFPGGPLPFAEAAHLWARQYANDEPVAPPIGAHCGKCQFDAPIGSAMVSGFRECWKEALGWNESDFAAGTVLDLFKSHRKQKLIDQGVLKLSQVQKDDLGDFEEEPGPDGLSIKQRQWMQVAGLPETDRERGYFLDTTLVRNAMSEWRFPYHFIDFETAAVALPFHAGMRPYQSVAFQFSHHLMEANGEIRHVGQFLCAEPGVFPNYDFARALMRELDGDDGTVFMWSHHENTILNAIARQLMEDDNPRDDREELLHFLGRLTKGGDRAMVDLCDLAGKAYFHPDTKGSSSIKKVLPAILKGSDLLKSKYGLPIYGALDGMPSLNFTSPQGFTWIDVSADGTVSDPYGKLKIIARDLLPDGVDERAEDDSIIAEGGAAATAYSRLQFEQMDAQTRDRIKSALLRYCELDTLAMAMVVEAWRADCHG
jgi:hypothetical protein